MNAVKEETFTVSFGKAFHSIIVLVDVESAEMRKKSSNSHKHSQVLRGQFFNMSMFVFT